MDFADKVVLITGASSGIGAACAVKYAEHSAQLALVGRDQNKLEETSLQCQKFSPHTPLVIQADITKEENLQRIIKETIDRYGKLDVLVNNAGRTTFLGISGGAADFDDIMATNVRAPYLLCSLALPHLIKAKGNILNISSILSVNSNPPMLPYCMSKAAVDMMTRCMAMEYASSGVRVNSVNPGPVKTEIFKRAGLDDTANEGLFKMFEKIMPTRAMIDPQEIAELVVFFTSDRAKSVTGTHHIIDGGLHLGDYVKL